MGAIVLALAAKLGLSDEDKVALTESEDVLVALAPRTFSTDTRDKLASKGTAMPDGSYPIPDKDALKRAIQAIGRAKNRAAVMAHIKKRAKALGATDMLPDDWK